MMTAELEPSKERPRGAFTVLYCPHCEIHFSGARADDERCPYCGRDAAAAPPEEASGEPPASAGTPGAAAEGAKDAAPDDPKDAAGGRAGSDDPPSPSRSTGSVAPRGAEPPSVQMWGDDAPPGGAGTAVDTEVGDGVGDGDTTRTEIQTEWAPGALVAGKYEVVSRLGAGGFGTVYKVRHVFRKKYYALKTPHAEFARDDTFRVRFEREIEAMERFVHSDAVMIRDSGVTESGTPYYTMDYIDGESLKVAMRREGRMSVERALTIIRRILRVLEVAHAHQIIHRDIKPDNILLTRASGRETVKVLDFGVAKLLDLVGESGSVTKGMKVGTPKYMSPEQITGEVQDPRGDLFSLGIVFYEMVTGEHPFARMSDPIRVTASILNCEPRPPIELVPDLPPVINDHILRMLEKRPKRRPDSASVLIRQLGNVEEGVSRVVPLESLDVCAAVSRAPAEPLVLSQGTSVGDRRSFLVFGEELSFGRANDAKRGIRNDLILRCLPCRSRELDPENWERNLTISQRLGVIRVEGNGVSIEPSPKAKYGIGIGGIRSFRPARVTSDRFHLSLGERALELDGHRRLRDLDSVPMDLSFLEHSRPHETRSAPPSALRGYSDADVFVDYVHLQRASNWPLHEYFLVSRQLDIGSSANVGLRLRCGGVAAEHALILREKGETFLLATGGVVFVRGDFDPEAVERAGLAQRGREFELPPRSKLVPLRPGMTLLIGEAVLEVDRVEDASFKSA